MTNQHRWVFDVNSENFYEEVIQKSNKIPVLCAFWAERIQPSKSMRQTLIRIVNEYDGKLLLGLINVELEQQIAMYLQLTTLPEGKLFIKGNVADEFSGPLTEQQLRQFLKKHIVSEAENTLEVLKSRLKQMDIKALEPELLKLIEKDKNNDKYQILLIEYYLISGEVSKAEEIAQNVVDPSSKFLIDALEYWRLNDKLATTDFKKKKAGDSYDDKLLYSLYLLKEKQDYKGALDILLELVRINKNYNNQIARKAIVSIFTILESGALVENYRNQLYNLIF